MLINLLKINIKQKRSLFISFQTNIDSQKMGINKTQNQKAFQQTDIENFKDKLADQKQVLVSQNKKIMDNMDSNLSNYPKIYLIFIAETKLIIILLVR